MDPLLEFFSTQRSATFLEGQAESLIDELRNKYDGRLVALPVRTALSQKTHQTAIAVPTRELRETSEAFDEFGGQVRFISTTHAIYSMAMHADPVPKGWESEIRVFLGTREGLILHGYEGSLVARQIFEYSGQAAGAVITAVNGMVAAVQEGLSLPKPDGVLFHVGQGDSNLADMCKSMTDLDAEVRGNIVFDQSTLATALSHEGFKRKKAEIDFLQQDDAKVKKKKTGESGLPKISMAGVGAAMLAMGGYLWSAGSSVQSEIDALYADSERVLDQFGHDAFALDEGLTALRSTAAIGEGFLMQRVYWADFLYELPRVLPANVELVRVEGFYPFAMPAESEEEEGGEGGEAVTLEKGSRFIEFEFKVPMESEISPIPEKDQVTDALRESEHFSRFFRDMAAPRIVPNEADGRWTATITIRCEA